MQDLIQNWRNAANANAHAAESHADIYGTANQTYVELKERAAALRDCAEHLAAKLESELDSGGVTPWGSQVNIDPGKSLGQRTQEAIPVIMQWLISERYRSLVHRHDGSWRAVDEAERDEWNAETLAGLVDLIRATNANR